MAMLCRLRRQLQHGIISAWRRGGLLELSCAIWQLRSKNTGVNEITFDLIFTEVVVYEQAKASPALDKACEKLLGRPVLGVYAIYLQSKLRAIV